jgi:hypothetical protein
MIALGIANAARTAAIYCERRRGYGDLPVRPKAECDRVKTSPLFELAHVFVRFNHVASLIVNANHTIMRPAVSRDDARQATCH